MREVDTKTELLNVIKDIKAYIKAEEEYGIGEILMPGAGAFETEKASLPSKSKILLSLKNEVLNCKACPLHKTRRNVVFGDGDPHAKLVFVGEAPGYDEDLQGLPFVGQAGKLLTKMIEAMGLSRDSVYICNVLKCRPPENRQPQPEEVVACKGYLLRQIEIISPKVICCLGRHASCALLETEDPISKIRGKEIDFKGIVLIPTFHPAYLLRNPSSKREVWEDLKRIKKLLSEE
ncbi:MAG: uracil-DNA glycosylase [Candidatus Omnitrophota bacterium]|nr:uracil-DNA glycosylase [Candidatus Omnitrophota bacterium]